MKKHYTKSIAIAGIFLYSSFNAFSQSNPLEWASAAGGAGNNEISKAVTVDNNGNVYTTGRFSGTSDFDPSSGTFDMTSQGNADVFIQKLNSNGDLIWSKQIGGSTGADQGYGITSDDSGIYIGGSFKSSTDFDPGTSSFTMTHSGSGFDGFILKLDFDGNFIWANQFGGSANDAPNELIIDENGDLLVTGYFNGTAVFGSTSLTASTNEDAFVFKMDSNGNYVWVKAFTSSSSARGKGITSDSELGVYITGWFEGNIDLDPSTNSSMNTSVGDRDAFMCKLDSSGTFIWGQSIGSIGLDQGKSLSVNSLGDIYLIGQFSETADFDSNGNSLNLISDGATDCFVKKMNPNGTMIWAKRFGGLNGDFATKIIVDPNDDIYLSGVFQGSVDFDLGTSEFILSSNGVQDFFIEKLNIDGDLIWAEAIGSTGNDQSFDAVLDAMGNIYVCGHYEATVDFDFGINTDTYTSNGERDIFVLKLEASCIQPDNTVTSNGNTISSVVNNVNYQWINCLDNSAIVGETGQSFTATQNGSYAVVVEDNNCSDTSECVSINSIGMKELASNLFSIFPNPTNDFLNINVIGQTTPFKLEIISLSGTQIFQQVFNHGITNPIDVRNFTEGMYFIKMTTSNGNNSIKKFQRVE